MPEPFDVEAIAALGWGQGAFLGPEVAVEAQALAPGMIDVNSDDRFIVTSHDCDVLSPSIKKEPVVEVLRAGIDIDEDVASSPALYASGRNPRKLLLDVADEDLPRLQCEPHDRWNIPRGTLLAERPDGRLPRKERRLVAEWLAKRYTRAAFPTEFDRRWRGSAKAWYRLLGNHSDWIQGVYLRLSTLSELAADTSYACCLLLAVPEDRRSIEEWPTKRDDLESEFHTFWNQFEPGIRCSEVEVLGTDEITLEQLKSYQRFDADWLSFDDETPATPSVIDHST